MGGLKWRQHGRTSSSQTSCLDAQQHRGTEARSSGLWLSAGPSTTCESFLSSQVLQESDNLDLSGGLGPGTLMLALFFRSADQAKKQTLCSLLETSSCALCGEITQQTETHQAAGDKVSTVENATRSFSFSTKGKLQQSRSVREGIEGNHSSV